MKMYRIMIPDQIAFSVKKTIVVLFGSLKHPKVMSHWAVLSPQEEHHHHYLLLTASLLL